MSCEITDFVIAQPPFRTASDVKTAVNKGGSKMAESGSVLFNFDLTPCVGLTPARAVQWVQ